MTPLVFTEKLLLKFINGDALKQFFNGEVFLFDIAMDAFFDCSFRDHGGALKLMSKARTVHAAELLSFLVFCPRLIVKNDPISSRIINSNVCSLTADQQEQARLGVVHFLFDSHPFFRRDFSVYSSDLDVIWKIECVEYGSLASDNAFNIVIDKNDYFLMLFKRSINFLRERFGF